MPTPKTGKLSWRFIAPNVHDFMWAADPEFIHKTRKIRDSLVFHLLYKLGGPQMQSTGRIFWMMRKRLFHLLKRPLDLTLTSNFLLLMAATVGWNIPWQLY